MQEKKGKIQRKGTWRQKGMGYFTQVDEEDLDGMLNSSFIVKEERTQRCYWWGIMLFRKIEVSTSNYARDNKMLILVISAWQL